MLEVGWSSDCTFEFRRLARIDRLWANGVGSKNHSPAGKHVCSGFLTGTHSFGAMITIQARETQTGQQMPNGMSLKP